MERSFVTDHSRPHVACVNENEVRAAAGLTMVIGAVAFSYAYFAKQDAPLQVAASLFFAEFLTRVTVGLRHSPTGVVARAMTLVWTAPAVGALLAFAAPASGAPAPSGDPVRFWSVSKVEQGAGEVPVTSGAQLGGVLEKVVDLGRIAFNFRGTPLFDHASGDVFSSADGAHYSVGATAPLLNPHRANSPKGAVTHLDEYQAYVKRSGDASLRIAITGAVIEAIDANARVDESLCPPTVVRCWPIRSIVRFHARAYAASAGGDFFNVGGVAFVKGRHALWDHWVATSSDSQAPVWTSDNFIFDPDVDDSNTFSDARMTIDRPPVIKVPLASVRTGELFAVHVSLEAEAVNDRGAESAVQAYIRDPQGRGPAAADGAWPQAARQAEVQRAGGSPRRSRRAARAGRHATPARSS